jgi:hypothetical protein
MDAPTDAPGTTARRRSPPPDGADALTEEELRAHEAEPLPNREAMSTLIWAPAPGTIVPPVDEIVGDGSP